jgi:hypothetical protein
MIPTGFQLKLDELYRFQSKKATLVRIFTPKIAQNHPNHPKITENPGPIRLSAVPDDSNVIPDRTQRALSIPVLRFHIGPPFRLKITQNHPNHPKVTVKPGPIRLFTIRDDFNGIPGRSRRALLISLLVYQRVTLVVATRLTLDWNRSNYYLPLLDGSRFEIYRRINICIQINCIILPVTTML